MKAFIFHTLCTLVMFTLTCIALYYNESCAIAFLVGTTISAFCNGVSLIVNIKEK